MVEALLTTEVINPELVPVLVKLLVLVLASPVSVPAMLVPAVLVPAVLVLALALPVAVAVPDPL